MNDRLYLPQRILLGLLVGTAGLYAGMLLMYSVGIAPMLDSMDPEQFLRFWQTHDYFLHLRIRFVYGALGAFYLVTLAAMLPLRRTRTFLLLAMALLLSAAEVQVNRTEQRPINRAIRLADTGNHTASSIYSMERQLFHALHLRQAFSTAAFALLCLTVMLPHGPRTGTDTR